MKIEYVIEGMTKLADLEERFGIHFEESEFETLNGYLISIIDRIPDEGERIEVRIDGYLFQIVKVEKNVIQTVLVTKTSERGTYNKAGRRIKIMLFGSLVM